MIFVSPEKGSADLVPLLEKAGLPVQEVKLTYADVEFAGRGEKGSPVMIGVEVKRLSELTGDYDRFAGEQLPKMNDHYDYRWLVYEGEWTVHKRSGALLRRTGRQRFRVHHGQPNAHALRKKLLTLEMCGGFHTHRTVNRKETIQFLVALYRFWTDDDLDEHKSHIVNYEPKGLIKLTKAEKAFAAWPGVSSVRAKAVAKHFKNSLTTACEASIDDLAEIKIQGKRLGTVVAKRLWWFIRTGGDPK